MAKLKSEKKSRRERAYELFCQGYGPSSPQLARLGLAYSTRLTYHYDWNKAGQPRSSKRSRLEIELPEGETVSSVSEVPGDNEKEAEESKLAEEKLQGEEKPKPEETEKGKESLEVPPGESKKKIPTSILGEGLKVTIFLSIKTLALYQIAANLQAQLDKEEELTLGDFLDTCAEDFFKVRGKNLGLIKIGGE